MTLIGRALSYWSVVRCNGSFRVIPRPVPPAVAGKHQTTPGSTFYMYRAALAMIDFYIVDLTTVCSQSTLLPSVPQNVIDSRCLIGRLACSNRLHSHEILSREQAA